LTEDKLWALFKYFDTDNSGIITGQNLKEAFAKTGKNLTDKEIDGIMKLHSFIDNGGLNFEEFKVVFTQDDPRSTLSRGITKSSLSSSQKSG
jgi:calcium-dependent protein kinase